MPKKKFDYSFKDIVDMHKSGMQHKDICKVVGCSRGYTARAFKEEGYWGGQRNCKAERHSSWKGGRTKSSRRGYVKIRDDSHPMAKNCGYVLEHIVTVENEIGRRINNEWYGMLCEKEEVHHINGVKDDNRIDNLLLLTSSEHTRLHGNGYRSAATIQWGPL